MHTNAFYVYDLCYYGYLLTQRIVTDENDIEVSGQCMNDLPVYKVCIFMLLRGKIMHFKDW